MVALPHCQFEKYELEPVYWLFLYFSKPSSTRFGMNGGTRLLTLLSLPAFGSDGPWAPELSR